MKQLFFFSIAVFVAACDTPDGPYEGQVANNLCALEVYPILKAESPYKIDLAADTVSKKDPYVRQEGLMVCRSY